MYAVTLVFPGFVARASTKTTPGVGALATLLGSVYLNRVGDGSKESKALILKAISDRQEEYMAGKTKGQFMIYPEGSTSNGEYLLSFKKGAFISLLPVQPMTALSHGQMI
jgi:1-acyl-sn-glycerol-3-phosphate acyltransferase